MGLSFETAEAPHFLCDDCGYLQPQLCELDTQSLDDTIYTAHFDDRLAQSTHLSWKRAQRCAGPLAKVESARLTGRILDVGCGPGRFLQVAHECGWQAFGIDPAMQDLALESPAWITILPTTLEHAGFPERHFDVVHAKELLEHVPIPRPSCGSS